ncbi:PREDICTED: protein N-lysine methyltransferase METTL21A-like [Priapulus caudatus]|uniref:Protein N-lysine methyltransferase METTL21A-like n=1 Tax=Priapulus caudatus TaxID=37621 RepID=A0ABM1ECD6_PRICU|nr:PREDICTED: protein N-lysine methyltransferase METTL21A-like [Priapulus caudatus]
MLLVNVDADIYDIYGSVVTEGEKSAAQQRRAATLPTTTTTSAVVLYEPVSLVKQFHEKTQNLKFAGRDIVLSQDWNNYGVAAVVWEAAIVLSEYLQNLQELVRNKNVIELGAGTGLVGIVAALLGGKVTITDRELVLPSLRHNVDSNLEQTEYLQNVSVRGLDWGKDLEQFAKYDVVLGADIVYIEDSFDALLATINRLTSDDSVVLLACKIRYDRDVRFLNMLRVDYIVHEVLHDPAKNIKIFEAVRKQ